MLTAVSCCWPTCRLSASPCPRPAEDCRCGRISPRPEGSCSQTPGNKTPVTPLYWFICTAEHWNIWTLQQVCPHLWSQPPHSLSDGFVHHHLHLTVCSRIHVDLQLLLCDKRRSTSGDLHARVHHNQTPAADSRHRQQQQHADGSHLGSAWSSGRTGSGGKVYSEVRL